MKNIISKIFNCILNILIGLVFICLVFATYNFINLNILGNNYTNYFGYTYFEILTGSMKDAINVDDYVFVKITKDVKKDDVISFVVGGDVITHRVIEDDDEIITKGDANNTVDEPITEEQVIGKVIYVGKEYGKYFKVITEPIVLISFFITIILFNIALASDKKERSAEDEKEIKIE